jgi:hypothetical protein
MWNERSLQNPLLRDTEPVLDYLLPNTAVTRYRFVTANVMKYVESLLKKEKFPYTALATILLRER